MRKIGNKKAKYVTWKYIKISIPLVLNVVLLFSKMEVGGGGGVSMFHNTSSEKFYGAIGY